MIRYHAEWADAFGLPFWQGLASHTAWREVTHGANELMLRAAGTAAGTAVGGPDGRRKQRGEGSTGGSAEPSLRRFSLDELVTMARPQSAEGLLTPFAWFGRSMVHPSELLTSQSCEALATYVTRRYRQLGATGTLLEVGAGSGHLAHHLNATGLLPTPLVATDIQTRPTPSAPGGAFPCEQLDCTAAIERYAPCAIVLCAWMPPSDDWTNILRAANVREYILLGDCCANPHASYNRGYAQSYERHVLEEVSRHMLHLSDADHELVARRGCGVACAVAYRRRE